MDRQTAFPDWILEAALGDDAFGEAYETTSPEDRALLKHAIARQTQLHGGFSSHTVSTSLRFPDNGLAMTAAPCGFAVFQLSVTFASPLRLLAALTPAILAGVGEILVVRGKAAEANGFAGAGTIHAQWPKRLLLALELAGVETVVSLDMEAQQRLGRALSESALAVGGGVVCALGYAPSSDPSRTFFPGGCQAHAYAGLRPCFSGRIGVFLEPGNVGGRDEPLPDVALLSAQHPDVVLEIWNGGELKRDDLTHDADLLDWREGSREAFLARGYDAVLVPSDLAEAALAAAAIVLTPGLEDGWIWPDVTPDTFRRRGFLLTP